MAHLKDDILKSKLVKADDMLAGLRRKYVQMTQEEVADPRGDEAFRAVMNQGKKEREELLQKMEVAEAQLAGIQAIILQQGTNDPKIMDLFNTYSKDVANLRGEMLKYEPRVIENAALNAKLNEEISILANITSWKAGLQDGSAAEDSAVSEEGRVRASIRQTKSKIARLMGSRVDEGTACDSPSQCGSKQTCVDHSCIPVASGSQCTEHSQCGNGHLCLSGKCSLILDGAPCENTLLDCGNGMMCVMGQCNALYPRPPGTVAEHTPCVNDGDCGLLQDCIADACIFVGSGTPCLKTSQCGNGASCITSATSSGNSTSSSICTVIKEGSYCTEHSACGKNHICDNHKCVKAYGLIRGTNIPEGADCDSGYDCGLNQYCKDNQCTTRELHSKCFPSWAPGNGQLCGNNKWKAIAEGNSCIGQEECGARQICLNEICRATYGVVSGLRHSLSETCIHNEDCGVSQTCYLSHCTHVVVNYKCVSNSQCGNGQRCSDGKCVLGTEGEECSANSDCSNSHKCILQKCRAVYGFNPTLMVEEYSTCMDSKECGYMQSCKNNVCVATPISFPCTEGCGNSQICSHFTCQAIATGSKCDKDEHCGMNQVCVAKKCRELFGTAISVGDSPSALIPADGTVCANHHDCGENQVCYQFQCGLIKESECADTSTCSNGQKCIEKTCRFVPVESKCSKLEDCGFNQICADNMCIAVYGIDTKLCPAPTAEALLSGNIYFLFRLFIIHF
jgi:hypothetical protein